uniref:Nuclear envelope phosphatase-regulatory subunit 1 n=1 Tax=Lates calcarifer TaxID=8187 RepID=A0A4W6E8A7_LATCA
WIGPYGLSFRGSRGSRVLGVADMNSLEQAEDLKAFERRLTEYVSCLQPATGRWRMILIVVSVCTATGAWNWLIDPDTQKVSFFSSLWNHPFFTISCITLIALFFAGIHKRVVAPSIIAARCRTVLAEYNMSCDDVSNVVMFQTACIHIQLLKRVLFVSFFFIDGETYSQTTTKHPITTSLCVAVQTVCLASADSLSHQRHLIFDGNTFGRQKK